MPSVTSSFIDGGGLIIKNTAWSLLTLRCFDGDTGSIVAKYAPRSNLDKGIHPHTHTEFTSDRLLRLLWVVVPPVDKNIYCHKTHRVIRHIVLTFSVRSLYFSDTAFSSTYFANIFCILLDRKKSLHSAFDFDGVYQLWPYLIIFLIFNSIKCIT